LKSAVGDAVRHVAQVGVPLVAEIVADLRDAVEEGAVQVGMARDLHEVGVVLRLAGPAVARIVKPERAVHDPGRSVEVARVHLRADELDAPVLQAVEDVAAELVVMR
jgi:hypothetical protein